ncbi:MAG TPA: AAA family ATPase [Lachnospiraceae bacterium]|nr:AAA family ATPase [Lachnospiraceae bacterium]
MDQILGEVVGEVGSIIKGKDDVIVKLLASILAKGHVLMEDIPGVGKTTLATTFARTLSLSYHRVQFTPDVLPSDLLGFSMYEKEKGEFVFREGAVFCNLFLADEINRTSPKTQSALLEVMEERQASVEGETRRLPDPFIVIATENPSGASGTQLLPESQLDRFMIRISMGYPKHEDAVNILKNEVWENLDRVKRVMGLDELTEFQEKTKRVFVHDALYDYMVSIVEKTREHDYFVSGASPRGTIALLRMSRAMAIMDGRDFVTAEDVQRVAVDVLSHRVRISNRAAAEGKKADSCIRQVLMEVAPPRL